MGKTVLIVDDSSMMRKMLKTILTKNGHQVIGEARDGEEAVQMYQAAKPDLVTMDVTMRGKDGFQAAQEILEFDKNAQILFLSNLDADNYAKEAGQIGALGFVNKHAPDRILEVINGL